MLDLNPILRTENHSIETKNKLRNSSVKDRNIALKRY